MFAGTEHDFCGDKDFGLNEHSCFSQSCLPSLLKYCIMAFAIKCIKMFLSCFYILREVLS